MKEQTYRMPIFQTIVLFLIALFFGYEAYSSTTNENWVLAVLSLLFGLSLFMYATYLASLSITISEKVSENLKKRGWSGKLAG